VYATRRAQLNQDSLKLNVTLLLLFYSDDVNILGESEIIIKENAEICWWLVRRLDKK
jgi:hypothetical protein